MADGTKIEWTEATANVINGCSVLSPGCTNCYAMRLAGTRMKHHLTREGLTIATKAGPVWNGTTRFHEPALQQVLRWQRGRMIFWNAHGDMFHDSVPDEWIDRCFAAMALTPQHKHQVLTKRSARMREYCNEPHTPMRIARVIVDMLIAEPERFAPAIEAGTWPVITIGEVEDPDNITVAWPLPNVWKGVSVEDQTRADERIPDLLATPAAVRWISAEPLLGPVDLTSLCNGFYFRNSLTGQRWHDAPENGFANASDMNGGKIDWVVAGGESGPNARPMHPGWARSIRDQCAAVDVPFFFKQWGEFEAHSSPNAKWADGTAVPSDLEPVRFERIGKKRAGRLLDGVQHDGYPA